ncbi:MAG: LysE family transporter [Neorhizobium sp.]|nr:LysE family transporter [Neorhizobium sp.]
MAELASSLLSGIGIGVSIAAPIGPMSILCIQRTLSTGLFSGVATGFGIATVHLTYGALAVLSQASFTAGQHERALFFVLSGTLLFWFSIRILRRVPILQGPLESRQSLVIAYFGAVGLGLLNPLTPLLFASVLPGFGRAGDLLVPVVTGIFAGSLGWWLLLSGSVSILKARLDSGMLNLINKAAGLMLAALAISIVLEGCSSLLTP